MPSILRALRWAFSFSRPKEDGPTLSRVVFDGQRRTNAAAAVTPALRWIYDLDTCPIGQKVHLLNRWGSGTTGIGTNRVKLEEQGFIAWAPMPDRDKDEEVRRGYREPHRP